MTLAKNSNVTKMIMITLIDTYKTMKDTKNQQLPLCLPAIYEKMRLENLQRCIRKVVHRYKSKHDDNFFNKRNVYLTQFNEDKLSYRCRISNFHEQNGFMDFGNHEYKEYLSDMILLTSDMGDDASYLIQEKLKKIHKYILLKETQGQTD